MGKAHWWALGSACADRTAKAIPALAIFAAPGGVLLLIALSKLLPFSLLPSAFQEEPAAPPYLEPEVSGEAAVAATAPEVPERHAG